MSNLTEVERKNIEAIGKLLQGFTTGNTDQVDTLVHDDFMNHNAPEGVKDKAGFKEIIKMVYGTFSQFETLDLSPEILFAKDNWVAMMGTGTGKRNGKIYKHADIHIFKMKNGQMLEHWNSFNLPCQREVLMNFMETSNQ
ncbi:ester cyclase [Spongiimicrobium sp. 3-5]|uniref:ester cyclase n=1 Tax=Spongiimicrobium sp. 3-5 TaxID=3332596 RepID=UPI00397EF6FA